MVISISSSMTNTSGTSSLANTAFTQVINSVQSTFSEAQNQRICDKDSLLKLADQLKFTIFGNQTYNLLIQSTTEIRKVIWPNRTETTQTTLIVTAAVLVASLIPVSYTHLTLPTKASV